ncbi:DUF4232 domain-containing protein [Streptomyces marokkonensis]|uniref:DUF4232 domain-containing protein n=1 Tax=Streptomyces marokkonensis TaxID=324855 RepID=A0ABW6Q520_9ACTN
MADRSRRVAAWTAGALVVLAAPVSCGTGGGPPVASDRPSASAVPTSADSPRSAVPSESAASPGPGTRTETGHTRRPAPRCRTAGLSAAVGRMDPGAGQRNLPIVLTNVSSRTCTLHGYPGAAFVDAAGEQLGRDPKRAPGDAATVTLAPGGSAWAGLRYASPGVSGARAATPAALLVTPPDERDALRVPWRAGAVPVSGTSSSVFLTVLRPGSGP